MREKILLCFGYGFSARAVHAALRRRGGWRVIGTQRSPRSQPDMDILPFQGAASPALQHLVESADAILLSIPPDEAGDCALRAFQPAFAGRGQGWIGYLSTTGVYGDRGGGWVDERSPRRPMSEPARRRALAEDHALALPRPACIFRLPGIYGPGRSALDKAREPGQISWIKPGQVFSRVHVADLAQALALSIAASAPASVYNVCDDAPCPPERVQRYAAALLGLPAPREENFDASRLSPQALRFWAENKRVSNARIKAQLGWRPRFPSYQEGLSSIASCDSGEIDHGQGIGIARLDPPAFR